MFRSKWMPLAAAAVLSGSVLVFADDATTQPSTEHHAHAHKLVKPWSELTDLTDDQKAKILEIHADANKEIKAITTKEKEDITALLTDDQKKEIADIESKSEKHKAEDAAPETQPAK